MTRASPAPAIAVVGGGRLAWSLAPALARAGYRVAAIGARDADAAAALAAATAPGTRATSPEGALDAAEVIFLAVPDGAIAALAAALPWRAQHAAVHCGGALGLHVLAPVIAAGGHAGCLHPLQSFPERRADPDRFRGITCGVEGAGPLGDLLAAIAGDLGARVVRLEGVERAAYHAAAVFASNDVVALMAAARRAWALAGLPAAAAREALAPLLLAVADNLQRLDPEAALTGPVARGDVATVEAHLAALAGTPDLQVLYRALGAEVLRIAPALDAATTEALRRHLEGPPGP